MMPDIHYFLAFDYDTVRHSIDDGPHDGFWRRCDTVPCFEDCALPRTIFRWIWLAVTFLSIS